MKIEITTDEAAKIVAAFGAAFGRVGAALRVAITALADAAASEDPEVKRVMGMCKEVFARPVGRGRSCTEKLSCTRADVFGRRRRRQPGKDAYRPLFDAGLR